jgi:hypothetical protein
MHRRFCDTPRPDRPPLRPSRHPSCPSGSLDKITAINAKMMQDRDYLAMLEKAKALWLEGSYKDSIVIIPG